MLIISIILEATITLVVILAARDGRPYMYGLAFTFGVYVLYDLARFMKWDVEGTLLSGLFLMATLSALASVWMLYKDRPR